MCAFQSTFARADLAEERLKIAEGDEMIGKECSLEDAVSAQYDVRGRTDGGRQIIRERGHISAPW